MASNSYAVIDREEEIEFTQAKDGNGGVYAALIEYCNSEISKVITGAVVGEASQGGSRSKEEVGENILLKISQSDKQNFAMFVNTTVLPRLISFGYPLQNLNFEWVEKEDITPLWERTRDALPYFDFDTEWLNKTFGFEITGKKGNRKRHRKFTAKTDRFFLTAPAHVPEGQVMTKLEGAIFDIKLSTEIGIGALLKRALKNLYDAKKAPDAYDKYLFEAANRTLQEAINEGFSVKEKDPATFAMGAHLRNNVAVFSAFKAHQQGKSLEKNLFDEKGNLVSFGTFRKKSAPILKEYNVRYLKAEYYTAARGSIMAKKWLEFEKDADLFPNLLYKPSSATTPREKHKALYGIIKPINDPFWDTYMPPNGWNCQCSVTNTDKAPNKIFEKISKAEREAVKPPEGVSGNPGKTKQIYTKEAGYIKKHE